MNFVEGSERNPPTGAPTTDAKMFAVNAAQKSGPLAPK
jgi:hypothetical protein